MYIDSIEFKDNYRCFNRGDNFKIENLTLLVGEQGCGKSSILRLLNKNDDLLLVNLTKIGEEGAFTFYFDSESMNPRMKDPSTYTNMDGTDCGIGYTRALNSRFNSHGETLVKFTVEPLKNAKNNVIFIDEPESGLSLRNQFKLIKEMKSAVDRECQLIVATHSLILIENVNRVLSLEHKKWMNSKDFIEANKIS